MICICHNPHAKFLPPSFETLDLYSSLMDGQTVFIHVVKCKIVFSWWNVAPKYGSRFPDLNLPHHPRIQSKSLGHDRGAIYLLLSSHLLFQLSRESFEQVFLIFWRHFKAERCVLYWRKILHTEFQMRWWWWRAKEEEEASWISARRQVLLLC